MRRHLVAPILATIALASIVIAAGSTAPSRGAAPSTPPRPIGSAPLSQTATIHRWFSQPNARQPGADESLGYVSNGEVLSVDFKEYRPQIRFGVSNKISFVMAIDGRELNLQVDYSF
jgi:hypothetical protein